MGIPKIIHYCWFGKGEKTKLIKKCMDTWKKYLPEYKIIEWNEENFDITCNEYVKEAYYNKKYAFVSDYVRLKVLYDNGGIYFDTDIEVLKSLNNCLEKGNDIYGFERDIIIMTGVMIANVNSKIIKEFLEFYENKHFVNKDGTFNITPNTVIFTDILKKHNLICNNTMQTLENMYDIYPIDYFCGYDMDNSRFNITENTITVHHYEGSWNSNFERMKKKIKRLVSSILGKNVYENVRKIKKYIKR